MPDVLAVVSGGLRSGLKPWRLRDQFALVFGYCSEDIDGNLSRAAVAAVGDFTRETERKTGRVRPKERCVAMPWLPIEAR